MPFPCAGGCKTMVFNNGETCSNCKMKAIRGGLKATVIPPKPLAPMHNPAALPMGANLVMKCRKSGQLAWIDVANNSTLYVLKDTTVQFKADSTGGGAAAATVSYETTQWGGTAPSANGAGATKNITFSANSATSASPSTLTMSFSGQAIQVNIITYSLNIAYTWIDPLDNFVNRSQTELGVDERLSLSFTTTPVGVTAVNAGGLLWKFAGGIIADRDTVGLLHNATTHVAPPANTGLADFIAPCRTAPAGQLQTSKEVALQLSVVAGPSIGLGPELKFRIHKPAAHMVQEPGTNPMHWSPGGNPLPSAGFYGRIYFAPKDVSFRTLRWREGTGTMVSSGAMAGDEAGTVHGTTVHVDDVHGTLDHGNANTGCYVNQIDKVRSAAQTYVVPATMASPITEVGKKQWPIQWEYTYAALDATHPEGGDGWTTDWIKMQVAHHTGTLFQNGRFEIFKGHVGCADCMKPISRDLKDPHYWPA